MSGLFYCTLVSKAGPNFITKLLFFFLLLLYYSVAQETITAAKQSTSNRGADRTELGADREKDERREEGCRKREECGRVADSRKAVSTNENLKTDKSDIYHIYHEDFN